MAQRPSACGALRGGFARESSAGHSIVAKHIALWRRRGATAGTVGQILILAPWDHATYVCPASRRGGRGIIAWCMAWRTTWAQPWEHRQERTNFPLGVLQPPNKVDKGSTLWVYDVSTKNLSEIG